MKLLVGTDKGLIVYRWQNSKWTFSEVHFLGMPIGCIEIDQQSGKWIVAINHKHWGPKIHISENLGEDWEEIQSPKFPEKETVAVKAIWTIRQDPNDTNKFYVGVEPAALFVTLDRGKNFEYITALSNHKSRKDWQGGGKGSRDPFLHTILIDRTDNKHLTVGISCAGVFQSFDNGVTWRITNDGLIPFSPNITSGVGHDPHSLKVSNNNPDTIWQQNHCGIFRSEDRGITWKSGMINEISGYGFAIVVDESNDQHAWVIPAKSDYERYPDGNKLMVYKTENAGLDWIPQTNGLPKEISFDLILRDSFEIKDSHLVFGTNNGNLYHSDNYGEKWKNISNNLSSIRSIRIIN